MTGVCASILEISRHEVSPVTTAPRCLVETTQLQRTLTLSERTACKKVWTVTRRATALSGYGWPKSF